MAISPGWKFSGPIDAHNRAPLIVRPIPGSERQQQEAEAEQQARVAIALSRRTSRTRISVATNAPTPTATQTAWMRARSRSRREIVTKPMPFSSRDEREQRGVGAARESADREVRDEVEAEHPSEEHPQIGRQLGAVGEGDEYVSTTGDDHHEETERELGATAGAGDQRCGHGAGTGGRRGRYGRRRGECGGGR